MSTEDNGLWCMLAQTTWKLRLQMPMEMYFLQIPQNFSTREIYVHTAKSRSRMISIWSPEHKMSEVKPAENTSSTEDTSSIRHISMEMLHI